jgi:hypothetical protein
MSTRTPMLEVARTKFRPGEAVDFQPADAAALSFSDGRQSPPRELQ